MKKTAVLLACALAALSVCAKATASAPALPGLSLLFDTLTMERDACRGQCPVYQVEVAANGRVRYTGKAFVGTKGEKESVVPAADVRLLSAALQHVDFFRLRDAYASERDGCSMVTDQPSMTFILVKGGTVKRVHLNWGCMGNGIPRSGLAWLSNTVDEIAKTGPLVYQPVDLDKLETFQPPAQ
jgi:hypothetical protein